MAFAVIVVIACFICSRILGSESPYNTIIILTRPMLGLGHTAANLAYAISPSWNEAEQALTAAIPMGSVAVQPSGDDAVPLRSRWASARRARHLGQLCMWWQSCGSRSFCHCSYT